MKTFNKNLILVVFAVCFVFGLTGQAMAATTPDLGAATNFAVLASTFNHDIALTTIGGDLGYVASFGVGGLTVLGLQYTSTQAKYIQAKSDQNNALALLNNTSINPCTFVFGPLVTDLAADTTHNPLLAPGVYEPGVYCTIGAASTAAVTLSGNGTYIFRIAGALDMVATTNVTLTNGASACDVFWTPIGATTIGATANFIGTIIGSPGITVGNVVTWIGRALASNYTVKTNTDTITVPTGCTLSLLSSLYVVNSVVGGTAIPSDFILSVNSGGVFYGSSLGIGFPGTAYTGLSAGTYTVDETINSSYTKSYSDDCSSTGSVTLSAGDVKTCTITNTYITPPSGGGGGSALLKDTCPNGDYSSSYYDGICGIAPAVVTGTNSVITTGSVVTSGAVVVTGTVVIVETNIPTTGVVIPGLPKTGFYIEDSKTPLSIIIFVSGFMMLSIAFIVVLRKYNI